MSTIFSFAVRKIGTEPVHIFEKIYQHFHESFYLENTFNFSFSSAKKFYSNFIG